VPTSPTPPSWFACTLAFACDGPDLDTVRAALGLRRGWVVHLAPAEGPAFDVVVSDLEQGDEGDGWAVYVVGHRYDDGHAVDDDYRGEAVRVPLAGARITVY
jgi:hypothetical protein